MEKEGDPEVKKVDEGLHTLAQVDYGQSWQLIYGNVTQPGWAYPAFPNAVACQVAP